MNKCNVSLLTILFCISVDAESSNLTPNSFDLVCDKVYFTGFTLDEDRVSKSYVKWDKKKKSLKIKSEELNEFHDELNPIHSDVYVSQQDLENNYRVFLTFKTESLHYAESWVKESAARIVSAQVDLSPKTKGAFLKLTSFFQTDSVISRVETKHARCRIR